MRIRGLLAALALAAFAAAMPLGAQQKQHGVYLDWQYTQCASGSTTCSPAVSFNVYRSTSATGPWNAATVIGSLSVGAALVACRSGSGQCYEFNDQGLGGIGGTAYFYAVTAADASGGESAAAVTASAVTFPASPTAPGVPVAVPH